MHRIAVIGAGYAGMSAAVSLAARTKRREDVRITVVNAAERFTERLRLHQTASGQELADSGSRSCWRAPGFVNFVSASAIFCPRVGPMRP